MQVFRIMGMPDKVIAFDSLPEKMCEGFELCEATGFPRHWKDFLGKRKRMIRIPPEKDFLTGQVRYFDPIVEEINCFYLVDFNINQSIEKWKEVCDFVKRVVPKDFRLAEKIDDMALPLAPNKTDGVTLEPEEIVVIPIPVEFQEKGDKVVQEDKKANTVFLKCTETNCNAEYDGPKAKQALRMHIMKKHKKQEATV